MPLPFGDLDDPMPSKRRSRKLFRMKRKRPTAKSNRRAIKKLQRIFELKDVAFYNLPGSGVTNAAWLPSSANLISVGNTSNTRVGDRVTMTSIQWLAEFTAQAATLDQSLVRFIILVDRQSNGVALTTTEVQNQLIQQQSPGVTAGVLSPFDTTAITRPGRFKILHNELITLNKNIAGVIYSKVRKGKRKLNMEAKWDADVSATIPVTNAIYSVVISDKATNGPLVNVNIKVIYKDA